MKRVLSIAVLIMLCVSPLFGAEKAWTFMVYINADNNLDSFGAQDQEEMAKVGSSEFLNIVTLIDREQGPASLNLIEKGNVKLLQEMGELDMGDYKLLASWTKSMMQQFPAKHYALIVWNHGSGWKYGNAGGKGNVVKGISYDDSSGNHITTEELGLALKEISGTKKLDIFGMDACLMQMMEVSYALKDSCDFVVGSEETEPGDGYPYDDILSTLKADTAPEDLCKAWVKAYAASYNNGSQGSSPSTQSALRCSKLDALKDCLTGFSKASIAGKFGTQFKDALTKVQKFYYTTNVDLMHLNKLLKTSIKDEAFLTAANKLELAINEAVVANGNCGTTMKNAFGLAIYFPVTSYSFDQSYAKLAFAQDCMWDEMVQDFYKKTTAPAIIADLEAGNLSSLQDYAASANANNYDVSQDLKTRINFYLNTENNKVKADKSVIGSLLNLL